MARSPNHRVGRIVKVKCGTVPLMGFIKDSRLRAVERHLLDDGRRIDELNEAIRGTDETLWPDEVADYHRERQRLAVRQTQLLHKRASLGG